MKLEAEWTTRRWLAKGSKDLSNYSGSCDAWPLCIVLHHCHLLPSSLIIVPSKVYNCIVQWIWPQLDATESSRTPNLNREWPLHQQEQFQVSRRAQLRSPVADSMHRALQILRLTSALAFSLDQSFATTYVTSHHPRLRKYQQFLEAVYQTTR